MLKLSVVKANPIVDGIATMTTTQAVEEEFKRVTTYAGGTWYKIIEGAPFDVSHEDSVELERLYQEGMNNGKRIR